MCKGLNLQGCKCKFFDLFIDLVHTWTDFNKIQKFSFDFGGVFYNCKYCKYCDKRNFHIYIIVVLCKYSNCHWYICEYEIISVKQFKVLFINI